jgi:uncharacterized protein
LFNTYSTSLIRLPKTDYGEIKSNIKNETFVLENLELVSRLYSLGLIVPSDFDEKAIIKIGNRKWRHNSKAYSVVIVPNIDCNFRCKYCFEDIEEKYMSEETINNIELFFNKRIISKQILNLDIGWYGGEPLLSKETIERLSKTFSKVKNYKAIIFSNGYDFDDNFIRNLPKLGINLVHITIDGPKGVHDSYRLHKNGDETFDRILDNIQKIITYNNDSISINIRTNLDNDNKDNYSDLLKSFHKINSTKISFQVQQIQKTLTGNGKSYCGTMNNEEYELVYKFAKEELLKNNYRKPEDFLPRNQHYHHCYVGLDNGFAINYDGSIYKCFGDINPPENSIGSLNKAGDIDFIPAEYLRWHNYDYFESISCRNCILLPICMGGCAHNRLGLTPNAPAECNNVDALKRVKATIKEVYEQTNKQTSKIQSFGS